MSNSFSVHSATFRPTRLGVVDNDRMTLNFMVKIMPQWLPGTQVLWYTVSGGDAARRCVDPELAPDMLLLDMSLGLDVNGLDATKRIRYETGDVPILGITSYSLRHYAAPLAKAGAQGLVTKSDTSMLVQGYNALVHGGVFSPVEGVRFDTAIDAHNRLIASGPENRPKLSAQETQIMNLLIEGNKYAQIAESFGVSESSIRTQTHRAVKKLGAHTLSQAIAIWVRETWQ